MSEATCDDFGGLRARADGARSGAGSGSRTGPDAGSGSGPRCRACAGAGACTRGCSSATSEAD